MQKIINVLALTSFVVSASAVGTGAYLYINREGLIESAKEAIIEEAKAYMAEAFEVPGVPVNPATSTAIPTVPFTF